MRLEELFETFIKEDPDSLPGRTVTLSLADLHDMSNTPYPKKKGPNGNFIVPNGFYDKKTYKVGGEDGVDVEIADAHEQFENAGGVKGHILKDGKVQAYNENNMLVDLGWALAAGTTELASSWAKGGAYVVDNVINDFTSVGRMHQAVKGEKISNLKTSTLSGYEKDKQFVLDRWTDILRNKTDESFRNNVDVTSGAVNTVSDIGDLFTGGTGFNLEGAAGIIIGELPSEIVDLGLVISTGPLAGMAATGVLNGLEAGGAAAQSITDRINYAHKQGKLQSTPQYQLYLQGAKEQLIDSGRDPKDPELETEAADLARKQAITMSIQNAFYKVAVTGGVIDAVQNRLLYKGPISPKFMRNAVLKGTANTLGEGVSEFVEQTFENLGIMDGAGNITYMTEGALNAAYNGIIASQSGNVLATGTDAAIRAKGGMARFTQFVMGGRRDPKAILDIMTMDSNVLVNKITTVDENGVRKFAISEMLKERLVTSDTLTPTQKKALARKGRTTINGEEVTSKQVRENDKNVELVSLLDNIEIDPKEGQAVINLGTEDEVRRMAQLIGVTVDGKKVDKKTDINKVLARLEDVRKIDVRVEGRSTLEAPIYSDLDEAQKMQYWKEGKVDFTGDPVRGNQTWSRAQILNNSRRNNDNIPDDVANLEANTVARPSLNDAEYAETRRLQDLVDNSKGLQRAKKELKSDQDAWDEIANEIGEPNAIAQEGPRPTADMEGDPYGFNTARNISAPLQSQINIAKAKLKQEQKAWDASYSETHLTDGSIKKGQAIFDEEFKKKIAIQKKAQADLIKANQAAADDAMGPRDGYKGPTTPVIDPATSDKKLFGIARQHMIANTKLRIATADMEPDAVRAMLKAHEKIYPGISDEIITKENLEKYEKVDLRPQVKDNINKEVVDNPPENNPQPALTKPPVGTVVEQDGQPYVWLGAMWAMQNPDGSRGTTNHQFHKPLLKQWNDGTISKDVPKLAEPAEHDTAPLVDKQAELLKKQEEKLKEIERNVKPEERTVIKPIPGVAQDTDTKTKQVTPGSVGPGNTPDPQGDPISGGTPPDPDEIRKTAQARADKIKADAIAQADAEADADNIGLDTTAQGDGAGQDNNPNRDGGQTRTTRQGQDNNPNTDGGQVSTEPDTSYTPPAIPKLRPGDLETSPKFDPITDKPVTKKSPELVDPADREVDDFNVDTSPADEPEVTTKAPKKPKLTQKQKDAIAGRGEFSPIDTPKIVGQPGKLKSPKKDPLPGVNPDLVPDAVTGPGKTLTKKQRDAIAGRLDTDPQDDADSIDIDTTTSTDDPLNVDTKTDPDTSPNLDKMVPGSQYVAPSVKKRQVKYTTGKSRVSKSKSDSKTARTIKGGTGKDKRKKDSILPRYTPLNISDPLQLDKYKSVGKDRGF